MSSSRRGRELKNRLNENADFLRKLKQSAFFLRFVKQIINENGLRDENQTERQRRSLRILKRQTLAFVLNYCRTMWAQHEKVCRRTEL